MKIKVTEATEIEKILCDHCGREVQFSAQYCIVCGRYACEQCFHDKLRCLNIQGPRFYGLAGWEPDLPHTYACKDCHNDITRAYDHLYAIVHGWRQAASRCKNEFMPLATKLAKAIEKREKEIEK